MSAAIDALKLAWRAYVTDGVPGTGEHEPDKTEIRAAFDRLDVELSSIGSGILRYETKTLLDANTTATDGQLAYVWGDGTAANNTVYQSDGGTWAEATWYFDAVAAVVQPLVDDAEAAAVAAEASAVAFETFRDNTLSIWAEERQGLTGVPQVGASTLAAGTWNFMDPVPTGMTLKEFGIMVTNTAGTVTLVRQSKSGAVHDEEEASAALALVGQPTVNVFDATDFGEIEFGEGEYLGWVVTTNNNIRRDTTNVGLTPVGYGGTTAHETSYTPTENVAFAQMQVYAIFEGPTDTVTAVRMNALEDAVGISSDRNIILFADSLGTDSLGFVDELAALLPDRTVTGQGVGGQQAGSIAVRTGGIEADATVSGASIPASGGGVTITAISPDPFAASIGTDASFIATLHDVPGVLSKASSTYTFTRSDTGGAISLSNPAKLRIRSTYAANTTGSGTILLTSIAGRVGVLRDGHNDVFNDVIRDLTAYDRDDVKGYIAAQVDALGGPNRVIVCSITRGYSWLTQARVDGLLGPGSGVTGYAADDAETIAAVIEGQALNQWMSDTFPGFVDLMAAYEASSAGYITSINLGSSHVYDFANNTILPDGTHGTDGGVEQTIAAQAVADKIDELGL